MHQATKHQPPPSSDSSDGEDANPFDYTNPLALIERAEFHLTWRVMSTRGEMVDKDVPPSKLVARKTIRKWARNLLLIILRKVQANELLETVAAAIERVMRLSQPETLG